MFFEYVVVAEADTDRAFYQEINERLLRFKAEWGVPNCLFLNAQNKQTVPSIVGPLRKLGIPTAGVVDVDVLKEGGTVWANQLDGVFVPVTTRTTLGTWRSAVRNAFEGSGKDMSNQGGLAILDADARSTAEELVELLSGYGLFVVSRGELEHWLPDLNKGGHGSQWLIKMFEVLGEDPDSADYVRPGDDDVWLFISQIKRWLEDTNRKGIPS